MLNSMRRIFTIYRHYRARLLVSQLLVLASAITTIWFASLNAKLVDQGITAGNTEVLLDTGMTMFLLALISGR